MQSAEYFLATRPAWPVGVIGLVAIAVVAMTLWAYLRHPQATRGRVLTVLALRLLALLIGLLTAIRPSLGVQEDPKLPSTLLVGIDLSETMSVADEVNSRTRIEAARAALEKCQPTIDELLAEQNVTVKFYAFGPGDFSEATNQYDPQAPASAKKSDYGRYLTATRERWRTERFVRGHLLIGDGADNGTSVNALTEAGQWRSIAPLHTVAVGRTESQSNARDVSVAAIACEPEPVPIKTDLTVKAVINQAGFAGATVRAVLSIDEGEGFVERKIEKVKLDKGIGNEVVFKVKAPGKPGEVKIKVDVPVEQVPGDVAPPNNSRQTYLTVTKEGVRILYVDRWRNEMTRLSDAWRSDKRIDVKRVFRQDDSPATAQERADFDFENNAYDAIVIGNISAKQLRAIDPKLPEAIREQVIKRGTGLLFLGGEATLAGTPGRSYADGWSGTALEEIMPVNLGGPVTAGMNQADNATAKFQVVPTAEGRRHYLMSIAENPADSAKLWDQISATDSVTRLPGLSKVGKAKATATVLAYASSDRLPVRPGQPDYDLPVLLAYHQIGDANRGRVAVFTGQDSLAWDGLNIRTSKDGIKLTNRFWKQMVLWLAHQEEDDGSAYARPQFRELPAGGQQLVRVGLRGTGGAEVKGATFDVKVIAPGQSADQGQTVPAAADGSGQSQVAFKAATAGEYTVMVKAVGKDARGADVNGEAQTRFFAYPDVSDEMLRTAADHEYLKSLAVNGGGQFYRLDDLPQFFKDLKGQPLANAKPKPRYLPDWRRNQAKGFLHVWLVLFVLIVGIEWGLRRWWGMV
jgi:hypothetical protein